MYGVDCYRMRMEDGSLSNRGPSFRNEATKKSKGKSLNVVHETFNSKVTTNIKAARTTLDRAGRKSKQETEVRSRDHSPNR